MMPVGWDTMPSSKPPRPAKPERSPRPTPERTRAASTQRPATERRSDPDLYAFLGRAIKVERTARGMDRRALAERSGISYPYLSEIENGSKRPSSQAVFAIAEALGIGPSELMALAEQLLANDARHGSFAMPAMRTMSSFHVPAMAADAAPEWRVAAAASPRDEREELIERIRLLVAALDLDDLVRVSDLIDRLRR